jgi:hypothetical protein
MNTVGKDGASRRVHLEADAGGLVPNPEAIAELENEIALPEITADVWDIFKQLDCRRNYNENGPIRFSWQDLLAYQYVNDSRLGRWKLKTVLAIEDAYFVIRAENKKLDG